MNPRLVPPARLARSVLRTQPDERLAGLAASGSEAAFEAIVGRYRRSLVRQCTKIVGEADAEEAVQDALLRAHAALRRGAAIRDVRAWLYVITHNAALNVLRARTHRPECVPEFDPGHAELSGPEQRETLREVLAAVHSLPARQRQAIVMRELEGRSYDEIAVRLDTSNGAVRQLLQRARAAMRDRMAALTGIEPLFRWLTAGAGNAGTQAGAISGGCAVAAKLCAVVLVPAAVASGTSVAEHPSRPRHRAAHAPAHAPVVRAGATRAAPAASTTTATAASARVAAVAIIARSSPAAPARVSVIGTPTPTPRAPPRPPFAAARPGLDARPVPTAAPSWSSTAPAQTTSAPAAQASGPQPTQLTQTQPPLPTQWSLATTSVAPSQRVERSRQS
jgi:RNA polymerase sigma factor (sigma-70 family)